MQPNKTIKKFKQLQQEPEDVRLRAANMLAISVGLVLVVIAFAILLPLQLIIK